MNARQTALKKIMDVCLHHQSLTSTLSTLTPETKDRALIQELCFGVLRYYHQLSWIANALLQKPFKAKDQDVFLIILLGLYQIQYMRIPDHAAVHESVNLCKLRKKIWAKNLVNAVLRNFLRNKEGLLAKCQKDASCFYSHPHWLIQKIQQDYPEDWQQILSANNQTAPMDLRVNLQKTTRDEFLTSVDGHSLPNDEAIRLTTSIPKIQLPGFSEGLVSIQSFSAQFASTLLEPNNNSRILDACAAPGNKTAHLLELAPKASLSAIEIDEQRLMSIQENLNRLDLTATVIHADASQIETWWDKQPFDRILLDAPCTATGVIRRHPDIKLLRRAEDLTAVVKTQQQLLEALWPLLSANGILLYATCSIFKEENDAQIARFLQQHSDANLVNLNLPAGRPTDNGWQILPSDDDCDGFYYAKLVKCPSN